MLIVTTLAGYGKTKMVILVLRKLCGRKITSTQEFETNLNNIANPQVICCYFILF